MGFGVFSRQVSLLSLSQVMIPYEIDEIHR